MHSYFRSKGYRALINAALFNGIGNSLFNIVLSSMPAVYHLKR